MRLIIMPVAAMVWWFTWIVAVPLAGETGAVQTPLGDFPWSSLVANGGALSILGWYLYYTTAYVNPKREEKHQEHIQQIVGTVTGLTDSFRQEARELRVWHNEQVAEARRSKER